MTTDGKIIDEKVQYDIKKEAAKVSPWSSGKIDKYQYFSEQILPSNQRRVIEKITFTYFPLGEALEKQTATIKD